MKKIIVAAAIGALLLLSGCMVPVTGGTPAEGEGPRATEPVEGDMPVEGEGVGEAEEMGGDDTSAQQEANFDQKITYPDGLEVEVIKIEKKELGEYAVSTGDAQPGDPYYAFSVRITNGTDASFDANLSAPTVVSGPDGVTADMVSDTENNVGDGVSGTIVKGKSKTGVYGFVIAHPDDVVMEMSLMNAEDPMRGSAIFAGSIE